jgi:hypothetical protein
MKQLICAIKSTYIQRHTAQTLFKYTGTRGFANTGIDDDPHAIEPHQVKTLEQERSEFDKLSPKEKTYHEA